MDMSCDNHELPMATHCVSSHSGRDHLALARDKALALASHQLGAIARCSCIQRTVIKRSTQRASCFGSGAGANRTVGVHRCARTVRICFDPQLQDPRGCPCDGDRFAHWSSGVISAEGNGHALIGVGDSTLIRATEAIHTGVPIIELDVQVSVRIECNLHAVGTCWDVGNQSGLANLEVDGFGTAAATAIEDYLPRLVFTGRTGRGLGCINASLIQVQFSNL